MKFHWFHLMPYPELPADFKRRYTGIWVDLPAHEVYDPAVGHAAYNDYLDELEFADQMGFDGVCVNEHHQNGYGLMPSPNLPAAALARTTSRAALVVLGNSIALYNPPVRVAEEFAMLDCMSGGRLVAGFPVGTPMDTVFCYGQNPATLRDKYQEAHDLIIKAWTERDPFVWNGNYNQLRYVNIWPRPLQKPHPPIWIPGGGSIETWEWVTERGYLYAYLSYFVAGDVRAGRATGSLSLQWGMPGARVVRYATGAAIDSSALDLHRASVRFGDFARVEHHGGRYELLGRFREAAQDHLLQTRRRVHHLRRWIDRDLDAHLGEALGFERAAAFEHLEEHRTERPDIGARIDEAGAAHLLG